MRLLLMVFLLGAALLGKELSLESEDGYKMYGWLEYPAEKKDSYPLAFFAHQFGSDHTIWNDLAADLRQAGYATLMVDLRGHGKSVMKEGKEVAVVNDTRMDHIEEAFTQSSQKVGFENIPSDLSLWLDMAGEEEKINMEKLVLFGSSLGGGHILSLLLDYEPKAAIAISPGEGNKKSVKETLEYAGSATLFIAGKDDALGAQKRAHEFANKALRGTYLMISSDGHGTVLLPRVQRYIMEFLKDNVK